MTFRSSEYDQLGFKADEIYPFLERHGVKLPRQGGVSAPTDERPAQREFPGWKRVMSVLPYLSLSEAAHAFADVDPHASGYKSDDEEAEIHRWRTVLSRALYATDSGDRLEAESEGGDTPDWYIKPANLAAWCARKGLECPLPASTALPSTSFESLDHLRAIETERDAKRAENDRLRTEVARLSERIVGKNREIASLERTIVRNSLLASARQEDLERRLADATAMRSSHPPGLNPTTGDSASRELDQLKTLVPPQPMWLMEISIAVQRRYWGDNWNADDRDTWASQADILEWLKQTYPTLSKAQRKAVELVACPVDRNPAAKRQA
ncbi:hypothetical protein LGM14_02625 [Burkholderia multivorans]|nr:hypothetical protein [Burkholderia multivorans]MDN7593319.1 hypothetical protein [Burkholderia multivorans]